MNSSEEGFNDNVMKVRVLILVVGLLIITIIFSCKHDNPKPDSQTPKSSYNTENVIVVIMDGARYSETWGDSTKEKLPRLADELSTHGVINQHFYNNGPTFTVPGHTSITTGFYQGIDNSGGELPFHPSFLQYWNSKNADSEALTRIVTSKDKLEVLSNCQDSGFADQYQPLTDCGNSGIGSGYRHDSITYAHLVQILSEHHPKLTVVNFREPDYSGHSGNWEKYIQGIRNTDEYIYKIWNFIVQDDFYQGKTTLFVTNDHGRHLEGVSNGFASHGDDCMGCRHIMLYAFGPDFKQGVVVDDNRELIDICATISKLFALDMPYCNGQVMDELFE